MTDEVRPRSGRASTANFVDIAPSVFGWGVPAVSLFCYRPQTGSICPSGGVFFPFVSERKGNRKEREFKGCALKNPPNCTDLLRSIKNGVFIIAEITGRAWRDKIVRNRKKQRRVCTDITSSAHEPSPRGEGLVADQNLMST